MKNGKFTPGFAICGGTRGGDGLNRGVLGRKNTDKCGIGERMA
ncbi:hypothetical protein [Mobiluncus porci]|nr:hypothetical protein [Mobiluncus porci]